MSRTPYGAVSRSAKGRAAFLHGSDPLYAGMRGLGDGYNPFPAIQSTGGFPTNPDGSIDYSKIGLIELDPENWTPEMIAANPTLYQASKDALQTGITAGADPNQIFNNQLRDALAMFAVYGHCDTTVYPQAVCDAVWAQSRTPGGVVPKLTAMIQPAAMAVAAPKPTVSPSAEATPASTSPPPPAPSTGYSVSNIVAAAESGAFGTSVPWWAVGLGVAAVGFVFLGGRR